MFCFCIGFLGCCTIVGLVCVFVGLYFGDLWLGVGIFGTWFLFLYLGLFLIVCRWVHNQVVASVLVLSIGLFVGMRVCRQLLLGGGSLSFYR